MATRYAALKLAGLEEAPCQFAVFADGATETGHRLGRRTMPEMAEYSVVTAVSLMWLAARAEGIGMGWVSILDPAGINAVLDVPRGVAAHRLFLPRLPRERERPPGAGARRMGTPARHANPACCGADGVWTPATAPTMQAISRPRCYLRPATMRTPWPTPTPTSTRARRSGGFRCGLYRQPGVADACIALQDECGVDVNVLLFFLWLAADKKLIPALQCARGMRAGRPVARRRGGAAAHGAAKAQGRARPWSRPTPPNCSAPGSKPSSSKPSACSRRRCSR